MFRRLMPACPVKRSCLRTLLSAPVGKSNIDPRGRGIRASTDHAAAADPRGSTAILADRSSGVERVEQPGFKMNC